MNAIIRGIGASVLATGSVSITILQILRKWSPEAFTKHISKIELQQPPVLSKLRYGALAGVVYALLLPRFPGNTFLRGGLFGLGLWTVNQLQRKPEEQLRSTNEYHEKGFVRFIAYILWGVSLGFAEQSLQKQGLHLLTKKLTR